MKVLVINGSPKGKNSITYQTVKFIQKFYPSDSFELINAAQMIKSIKKDFSKIKEQILNAEFILFSYPVYTFIAPAQLHEFISIMKENFKNNELSGKGFSQITTSKHFYDVTAQDYVKDNCLDLNMIFYEGLFADMDDLTKKRGQQEALDFWRYVKFQFDTDHKNLNQKIEQISNKRIALVTDISSENTELRNRVEYFKKNIKYEIEEFNIAEFNFMGGCISCFKCSGKGECVWKDGFSDILRNKINTADAIVYAFTIKDHSMGVNFKYYDDRQFCNGHRTMTMDKPIGYIINGDYENERNLDYIIKGRASVGHNILTHIATQKQNDLDLLISKLSYCLEYPVVQPQNFYGVGGMKIFRDLIYIMAGFMKADYKFYKKEGFFKDLPTRQKKTRFLMRLVGLIMSNEKLMKKAGAKVSEGMLMPYNKVLDEK